ncbi:MAG: hypothetical protein ACI9HE_000908 [Planctomycetota bacterium]|jgi:hypothetical protein
MKLIALLSLALCTLTLSASAQEGLGKVTLEEYELTLDFSSMPALSSVSDGHSDQVKGIWRGEVGRSQVHMTMFMLSKKQFGFGEPMDVTQLVAENKSRQSKGEGPSFAFDATHSLPGSFGVTPYGSLGIATGYEGTKATSRFFVLGGLLPEAGYALEIRCTPILDKASRKLMDAFLREGVTYGGEQRDPNWTDEEIEARWQSDAPDKVLEKSKLFVVRTKYYAILTNLKKGTARSFGKKMDECYEEIRKLYPFEDIEGQRLLPIFYFTTSDSYFEWCVKNLSWSMANARKSGGVATGDVYATYHQSTTASVHIHEGTHQVFGNRLHLRGGGSWFQEGVASYIDRKGSALSQIKGLAKDEKLIPLREFFVIPSMLYSAKNDVKGGSGAGDSYNQAASVVEFVRHSKFTKDKFYEYIHGVGAVSRGDLPAIEKVLQKLWKVDVEGFEAEYLKYWTKRKKAPKKK